MQPEHGHLLSEELHSKGE